MLTTKSFTSTARTAYDGVGSNTATSARGRTAWNGGGAVDEAAFLSMQQELAHLKQKDVERENIMKKMSAQLHRTEEAAKRALVMQHQVDQHGNLMPKTQTKQLLHAHRILELEKEVSSLETVNRDLTNRLSRAKLELAESKKKALAVKSRTNGHVRTILQQNQRIARLESELKVAKSGLGAPATPMQRTAAESRAFAMEHTQLIGENEELRSELERLRHEAGIFGDGSTSLEEKDAMIENLQEQLRCTQHELQAMLGKMRSQASDQLDFTIAADHTLQRNALDVWVLEEVVHGGVTRLRDPQSLALFVNTRSKHDWPSPLGMLDAAGNLPPSQMERFMVALDKQLRHGGIRELFDRFDSHKNGALDRDQMSNLLLDMYCDDGRSTARARALERELSFAYSLLDMNGDGTITFTEFSEGLRNAFDAYTEASAGGQSNARSELMDQLLEGVRSRKMELAYRFEQDADSGAAGLGEAAVPLHKACSILLSPPFTRPETLVSLAMKRMLMLILLEWDFGGQGTISAVNVLRMLRAVELKKLSSGQTAPGPKHLPPASVQLPASGLAEQARQLKEAQAVIIRLQEEKGQLSSDLDAAKLKLAQLEDSMLNPDHLQRVVTGNPEHDTMIRAMQSRLEQYMRNYRDTKQHLEALKARQLELTETLQETHDKFVAMERKFREADAKARRFDDVSADNERLRAELQTRVKAMQTLQDQLFSHDSKSMQDVDKLKSGVFELKTQLRKALDGEAAARRDLQRVIDQSDSITVADFRRLGQERDAAVERAQKLEAEVQRLSELLKLYMAGAAAGGAAPDLAHHGGPDFKPQDFEALKRQWEHDSALLQKLQKLYDDSAAENDELRATNGELERRRHSVETDRQREIDRLQLRLDRAQQELERLRQLLRAERGQAPASTPLLTAAAEDLADVPADHNVFEVVIERGDLAVDADVSSFITLDFYDHPTQVSTKQTGPRPAYNSTIQYIVPMDVAFLRYMIGTVLQLELNQVVGFEWSEIGRAQLNLAEVKQQLQLDRTCVSPVRRNLPVRGAADKDLGTVTITYRMLRPLQPFLRMHEARLAKQLPMHPDTFTTFAARAAQVPSRASSIQVTVLGCSELVAVTEQECQPYVQYEFPGYPRPINTKYGRGTAPDFNESYTFEFAESPQTSPEFVAALRQYALQLVVFDAAADGDDAHVGLANVSLKGLTDGARMISARFELEHPITQKFAGYVHVAIQWCQVLQLPRAPAGPPSIVPTNLTSSPAKPLSSEHLDKTETVMEVTVVDAAVQDGVVARGQGMHAAFEFFGRPPVTTPSLPGLNVTFNYSAEYKVPVDDALCRYLEAESLRIEFFTMPQGGWEADLFGVATLSLREIANAMALGRGIGDQRVTFSVPIVSGRSAHMLGQCKVAFRSLRAVQDALEDFRRMATGIGASSCMPPRDAARLRASLPHTVLPVPASALQSSPARDRYTPLQESVDAFEEKAALVRTIGGDPSRWPVDTDNHLIISIHCIQLLSPLFGAEHFTSFQLFWSLLDSLVEAEEEATRQLPRGGVLLSCGDTFVYNLRGVTEKQRRAQALVKEKLAGSEGDLMFALAGYQNGGGSAPAMLCQTDSLNLRDLMYAPERQWQNRKLPMYSEHQQHVADVTLTIVAERALNSLRSLTP